MFKSVINFGLAFGVPLMAAVFTAVICQFIPELPLPPGSKFYADVGLEWITAIRVLGFIWLSLCLLVVTAVHQRDVANRRSLALKRRCTALANFFATFASWSLTFPGIILFGGDWNIASWVFGFFTSASAVYTCYVMITTESLVKSLIGDIRETSQTPI